MEPVLDPPCLRVQERRMQSSTFRCLRRVFEGLFASRGITRCDDGTKVLLTGKTFYLQLRSRSLNGTRIPTASFCVRWCRVGGRPFPEKAAIVPHYLYVLVGAIATATPMRCAFAGRRGGWEGTVSVLPTAGVHPRRMKPSVRGRWQRRKGYGDDFVVHTSASANRV